MTRTTRPNRLYRWFDEVEALLYIGITGDPVGRVAQHFREARWMDFAVRMTLSGPVGTEAEAQRIELAAIAAEKPVFNRKGVTGPCDEERAYLEARGLGHLFRAPGVSRPPVPAPPGLGRPGAPRLTTAQAAALLRVTPSTVWRLTNDGRIAFTLTPGGHRRYAPDVIAAYKASYQDA